MSRRLIPLVVVGAALSVIPFAANASASSRGPVAHVARSCSVGTGYGYGYSYLTSLTVRNASCGTGQHVAKRHGRVGGWHCSKKRLDTSPVQYDDRETCTSRSARVVWTFTQNT